MTLRSKKTQRVKPFSHDIRVRYGETDQMGIVYHANYIIWFNDARDALLGALGVSIPELEKTGLTFPVTEVNCKYLRPARYGDVVRVSVTPEISSVAKLVFNYQVTRAKSASVLCTGTTTSAVLDPKGKMLIKMPSALREFVDRLSNPESWQNKEMNHD